MINVLVLLILLIAEVELLSFCAWLFEQPSDFLVIVSLFAGLIGSWVIYLIGLNGWKYFNKKKEEKENAK